MIMLRIMGGLFLAIVFSFSGAVQERKAGEEPNSPELIDRLNTRNWAKAVEDLVGIGEPAVGPLIEALSRDDRFIPGRACIALARIGTPAAVEAVYGAFRRPAIRTKDDVVAGRSIAEITDLGRPGGLSTDGFLTGSEDTLTVLAGDNRLVSRMGLTHPELARPLFHIWNMILADTRRNS